LVRKIRLIFDITNEDTIKVRAMARVRLMAMTRARVMAKV
jgi:hypothetical protein